MLRSRFASAALVLLASLAAAGCHGDDPTAPYRPLAVTVTVDPTAPYIATDDAGAPLIGCDFHLNASAQGTDKAVWEDGMLRFVVGVSHRTPVDSQAVSAADMRSLWGEDTIPVARSLTTGLSMRAGVPFGAEFVMRYRNVHTGEIKSATAVMTCVPTVTVDATPLAITSVTVTPSEVQPGDMINVSYTASAGVGVWETMVVISGAVDTTRQLFSEAAAKTVTHQVNARIPATARLGEMIKVDVYALDADLNEVGRSTQVGPVRDLTPPTLTVATNDFPYAGPIAPVAGQYAEGDTIHLVVTARDNQRLRWIVYSLGAPANVRDSIAMIDTMVTAFPIKIPVQAGWTGSPTLTIYAQDPSGLKSTPVTTAPGALHIYPTVTHPVRSASIDGDVTDIALDERRQLIYVAQGPQRRVAIVSMQSLAVAGYVALPSAPSGLDISPGGDSLVVALPDGRALAVVDLAAPSGPVALITVTAADTTQNAGRPLGIRIAANGKALVPLNGGMHWTQAQTLEVDIPSGTQRVRSDLPLIEGETVSRSGDRSAVVVSGTLWSGTTGGSCGYRYLAASDAFGGCHAAAYGQLGSTTTGNAWTNGAVLMAADLSTQKLLYVNNLQYFTVALSPDGDYAYLTSRGWMTVERTSDNVVLERAPFGPVGRTLVTADGATLFCFESVWNAGGNRTVRVAAMTLQ